MTNTKAGNPTDQKIATLRAARLARDAQRQAAILEQQEAVMAWFRQSIEACKAEKMPPGRIYVMLAKRGVVGTMARCIELSSGNDVLALMKEKGLLPWSVEEGVKKFAECFEPQIVALARSRLAAVAG